MSAKPESDRSEPLSEATKHRLDAARGKYDALRRSYEHLLGQMDQGEGASCGPLAATETRRGA